MDNQSKELLEVKNDEEQKVSLLDICDLLLAAGYFRARLKGISAFDKVVGGMVWCLEMCAVDVDVNFLFRENLNIKEKIEITEKIIQVLVSMKCAYALEPHQIQGLDAINIKPVVQWLVKRAMETRELSSDHLRSLAVFQFDKNFEKQRTQSNINSISKTFYPQRKFKRKTGSWTLRGEKQVLSTLAEYGYFTNQLHYDSPEPGNVDIENAERPSEKKQENRAIAQCVSSLLHQKADLINQVISGYASRAAERQGERDKVAELEKQKQYLLENKKIVAMTKESEDKHVKDLQLQLDEISSSEEELLKKRHHLIALQTEEKRQMMSNLERLVVENEIIVLRRKQFKNECKVLLGELQTRNQTLKESKSKAENVEAAQIQLHGIQNQLANISVTLGERNVTLGQLRRQLDAIPGSSELNQYHRRFTELCNQVNQKQTELNGYYHLYNTLEDTKVYLNKELSLLTSIHEKFTQSMESSSTKIEFLQQMENIVLAVENNKKKIKEQSDGLSTKYRGLQKCLSEYVAREQQYREILKYVGQENLKYKKNIAVINAA